MINLMKRFWNEEEGQDLAEYALLLAFLALATIAAITTLSEGITAKFEDAATKITAGPA